jgi:hypothetical protein
MCFIMFNNYKIYYIKNIKNSKNKIKSFFYWSNRQYIIKKFQLIKKKNNKNHW